MFIPSVHVQVAAERMSQIRVVKHFATEEREKAHYACVRACVVKDE